MVASFRAGDINLLVSTSVGSEGLDFRQCQMVGGWCDEGLDFRQCQMVDVVGVVWWWVWWVWYGGGCGGCGMAFGQIQVVGGWLGGPPSPSPGTRNPGP